MCLVRADGLDDRSLVRPFAHDDRSRLGARRRLHRHRQLIAVSVAAGRALNHTLGSARSHRAGGLSQTAACDYAPPYYRIGRRRRGRASRSDPRRSRRSARPFSQSMDVGRGSCGGRESAVAGSRGHLAHSGSLFQQRDRCDRLGPMPILSIFPDPPDPSCCSPESWPSTPRHSCEFRSLSGTRPRP